MIAPTRPMLVCALLLAACSTQPLPSPVATEKTPAKREVEVEPAAKPIVDRTQECAAVQRARTDELGKLSSCTSDAECGKTVPTPGSCGCTQDAVVRLDADLTEYTALMTRLDALHDVPGCARLLGMCMCLPSDGFMCDDGHCRWKPLDRSTLCSRTVENYVGTRKRECEADRPEDCTATLTLKNGKLVLREDGTTRRGRYKCRDGTLSITGDFEAQADVGTDGSVSLLIDVFKPAPSVAAPR